MQRPNQPGITFEENSGMSGQYPAYGEPGFSKMDYMQRIVDRMDDSNPLKARFIAFYGLSPTPASVQSTDAVRVNPRGTPGQEDYTIEHGPIGGPRGRPSDPNDPYYAENYGMTDDVTPWLIAPQPRDAFRGGETGGYGTNFQYGIPASSPIGLPPAGSREPANPPAYGERKWDNPRPSPQGQKGQQQPWRDFRVNQR